jgi:hypothetical protein
MKLRFASCCLLALAISTSSLAFAQAADSKTEAKKPAEMPPATISSVLEHQIAGYEKEFVSAAEAMPADKYNFAPTQGNFKGVRTFAEEVKHVALANNVMFGAAMGEKAAFDPKEENGPASITSKEDIVKYLKDSFATGHRAATSLTPENFLERTDSPFGKAPRVYWATAAIAHGFDHYGQMVEYLRMNGIVPPASMPEKK